MKRYLPIIILLSCLAAFVFGIVQLFELRFENGDVYPPYSSLRADPLGAMAFYESLEKIPGLALRRDFNALDRLPEDPHTAYLHLSGEYYEWHWVSRDLYREIQDFLARDGRLVITLHAENEDRLFHFRENQWTNAVATNTVKSPKPDKSRDDKKSFLPPRKKNDDDENYFVHLDDRWGLHTRLQRLETENHVFRPASVTNRSTLPLPRALSWHSGLVFTNVDPAWQVIYARGTNPVVMERHFGRGSVVVASDSYFVSNEAMQKDRHADLLAWLIGPAKNIVFDEAHFGIVETPGVASLMRKYRLHGLLAGLALLAGLFVWKNSTSLVPSHRYETGESHVAGRDSGTGFVNLLRRSIPPADLLAACFEEWKKNAGKQRTARTQQAEAIFASENALPAKERNPVAAYQKISEALNVKHPKHR